MVIWSFKQITELKGRTGFVDCERNLAQQLIADGHAQDPKVGANYLKAVEKTDLVSAYEAVAKKTTKKRKASDEDGDK
jgi:hypothetical protein